MNRDPGGRTGASEAILLVAAVQSIACLTAAVGLAWVGHLGWFGLLGFGSLGLVAGVAAVSTARGIRARGACAAALAVVDLLLGLIFRNDLGTRRFSALAELLGVVFVVLAVLMLVLALAVWSGVTLDGTGVADSSGNTMQALTGAPDSTRTSVPSKSPIVTGMLVVILLAGLGGMTVGLGIVWSSNSPANRQSNPWADLGVVFGGAIAVVGAIFALIGAVAFFVRSRRD
ncbi:MAG TPA: hypothetical protein VHZ96_19400 [Frankiaceae bacterium]|nr:hypothetical protein [Frankiaceae bacterium]